VREPAPRTGVLRDDHGDPPGLVQEDRVVVTTTATSLEGVRYPIFVGLGTGKFRGSTTDFGHPGTGRVRAGDTSGRGLGGIRPDMFHMRAKDKSEKKLTAFVKKNILPLLYAT